MDVRSCAFYHDPVTAEPAFDPPLRRLFEALRGEPAEVPADLDVRRAAANATMLLVHPGPEAGVTVEDRAIPVEGGEILVRIRRPDVWTAPGPALFFVHGGGWFQGNLDTAEVECGPMASAAGCVVVSVDYRLAPEHPFPTPLHDVVAAYEWTLAHADELGIDAARIVAGGTSAGGNLVAALCLVLRDRGLPLPIAQVLDVPAVDLTLASPSMDEVGTGAGLTKDAVAEYAGFYLDGGDPTDPYASPIFAADLSGLPPAVIVVAEHDPVRDDGERYLARLHAADVPGFAIRVLAHFHGSWIIPVTATNRLLHDLRVATLRRAFDGTLVP
jgi:acetyl esterase